MPPGTAPDTQGITGLMVDAAQPCTIWLMMSDDVEAALKRAIKEAMVEELMLQQPADEIGDDVPLFAPTGLGLDSVDALQLVVTLEKRFGLKISDAEAAKGILRDVSTMAAAVQAHQATVSQ